MADTATRGLVDDIHQLSISLETFKTKYKVYPPSFIHLYSNRSMYSTAAEMESLAYLVNIWPKLDNFTGIAWDGTTPPAAGYKYVLEGDQCLVFFLGGIPGTNGFSTNPINPADPATDRFRFFEFKGGSRMKARVSGSPFLSFYDAYESQPYLYFSSGRSKNLNGGYVDAHGTSSDGTSFKLTPYKEALTIPAKYYRPTSFQIICAGIDGQFGAGGLWNATAPALAPGYDDFTNFHGSIMGAP